jgi:hypothetical protein
MAIQKVSNFLIYCLHADTKPTTYANNTLAYELDTGNIYRSTSGVWSMVDNPSMGPILRKRWGAFYGTSSTGGAGTLNSTFTTTGSLGGALLDSTNGEYYTYTSGAVSGNVAALKCATAFIARAFNPVLWVKFYVSHVTNTRTYIGLKPSSTDPASGVEDPIATANGIMLVQRSTDTNWQIATNNTGANSNFTSTGVAAAANTVYTLQIVGDDANSRFLWSLNGSTLSPITTQVPSSTSGLTVYVGIQTAEAVAHSIRIYSIEIVTDK